MGHEKIIRSSYEEENLCSICLSPFSYLEKEESVIKENNIEKNIEDCLKPRKTDIAYLGNCRHFFHYYCIELWVKIANTCPVCRYCFDYISLSRFLGGPIFAHHPVEKRVKSVDFEALNEEDICRCIICGSCEDEQVLLLCDGCDDGYHTYCLGLDEVPRQDFFCPTCITLSEEYFSYAPRRRGAMRRSGLLIIGQRVNRNNHSGRVSSGLNRSTRQERMRNISLNNRWFQRAYHDYGLWGIRNNEAGGERNHTSTSLAYRDESSYNSGKSRSGLLSLSPEEKAWKMYEVQKCGEKIEKYDDSFKDDFLSLTSQKKFKRPLIARNEIKNMGYTSGERISSVSNDDYSISYVKGKAKENNDSQLGFLQNLLNDISNTSNYSYQLKHDTESFENYYNKVSYDSETSKKKNSSVFISNVSFTDDNTQKDSFQSISDTFSGTQSKKVYHSSAMSSSMALSESFLTTFSSFSSKSTSKSPIISPGRKIAFTIKKKIEKIVSKELRLYYPEKISKDTCKSINKRVCRMIYEDVALLGEHMFDDFDNLWYDKIKTEIMRLIKDIGHI
ncbi:hypothetical protein PNEG_00212 [Pneumocystis murina B123]|uniref:PHD-type domain-containing protein n=1 Tax=Pneumocystis murina (strain B123) TaxID=1069680 RepID=M7PD33_PNEMU|nr:hypothetical protein PNEG_00212 [Pneumocystis murina B123]EMR11785.1 hypothetical protein PNEG_00212 [Pneumocystis murina B123]